VAVSVAAELSSTNYRDTGITLTPAGKGTFQVFVNGKKVYDRKEPDAVDFLPALKEIHKIRDSIKELFAEEPATAGAH
jgi:predicted Rdx family selenoprotein